MSEPNYAAEMQLAPGVTCDDCAHARRCFAFGYSKSGRASCDFWPSRFRAAPASPADAELGPGRTQTAFPKPLSPILVEGGDRSSVADGGGTASPKSENEEGH